MASGSVYARSPNAYFGDDRKDKDQGVVTTEAYGVPGNMDVICKSDDRHPPPGDATALDIEIGDVVYTRGKSTDDMIIPPPTIKLGTSQSQYKSGVPHVIASLAGAPRGMPFYPLGVAMTRWAHNDTTTHLMTVAHEGTFPVLNTGTQPIRIGDIVASRDYTKSETPIRFDGMPNGKLLPVVYSLTSILGTSAYQNVSADLAEHSDNWLKEVSEEGKMDESLEASAHRFSGIPNLGNTIKTLNEITDKVSNNPAHEEDGNKIILAFANDTFSMIRSITPDQFQRFTSFTNSLSLYIYRWLVADVKHRACLRFPNNKTDSPDTFLMACINKLLMCRAAFFCDGTKQLQKYTILGVAMSDAKTREQCTVYFNKSVG